MSILIYSTKICPYCVQAKQLLDNKGVTYEEVYIDNDLEKRDEMIRLSGRRTVPQIFIHGLSIGGCDDLYALERAGKLDAMLKNRS